MTPTRRSMSRLMTGTLCSVVALITIGCSRSTNPTSGVVQFDDGSPVTSGSVELRRLSDKERFAGRIASDGTFPLADEAGNLGVPPGSYEAVVVQIVLTEDLALEHHTHGHTVPRRYADYYTSGLKIEVEDGQVNPIEIVVETNE